MDDVGQHSTAGAHLQRRRERLGWTRRDLAAAAGLSKRTIDNYERQGPPAKRRALLERVLGDREAELGRLGGAGLVELISAALAKAIEQDRELRGLRDRLAELSAEPGAPR